MRKFTVILEIELDNADDEQVRTAMLDTEQAIRNRLFGEGYLPDDETCVKTGGAQHWWDSWCAAVAGNRANKSLSCADQVSAFHYECIA